MLFRSGWFFAKNKWWESAVLILAAFLLFRPGFVMDRISPTAYSIEPVHFAQEIAHTPVGQKLMLKVAGINPYGKPVEFYSQLEVPEGESSEARLNALGLTLLDTGDKIEINGKETAKIIIDNVELDSPAAKAGLNWDQTLLDVSLPKVSLPKELMFIPALLMIFGIAWNQRRRHK